MHIQINTGHTIDGTEAFVSWAQEVVEAALSRRGSHITRVEVHLRDENGDKTGQHDKHCTIEARLEGHKPMAVTHQAPKVEMALKGAADKLDRLIENTLGRLHDRKTHRPDPALLGAVSGTDA
jgi:ribosome-associated translation inhibitor RaiA